MELGIHWLTLFTQNKLLPETNKSLIQHHASSSRKNIQWYDATSAVKMNICPSDVSTVEATFAQSIGFPRCIIVLVIMGSVAAPWVQLITILLATHTHLR
jgi:hypothetical protein